MSTTITCKMCAISTGRIHPVHKELCKPCGNLYQSYISRLSMLHGAVTEGSLARLFAIINEMQRMPGLPTGVDIDEDTAFLNVSRELLAECPYCGAVRTPRSRTHPQMCKSCGGRRGRWAAKATRPRAVEEYRQLKAKGYKIPDGVYDMDDRKI